MTDVAERVFDRCLNYGQEKNPERPAYEITFNYEFLDDTYMPWIHEDYRKRMRADDTASMSDSSSMGKTKGVGLFWFVFSSVLFVLICRGKQEYMISAFQATRLSMQKFCAGVSSDNI